MTVSLRISTLTNGVLQNTRMAYFLRSVEREDAPLSLFVEDLGIYYDASAPMHFSEPRGCAASSSEGSFRIRPLY